MIEYDLWRFYHLFEPSVKCLCWSIKQLQYVGTVSSLNIFMYVIVDIITCQIFIFHAIVTKFERVIVGNLYFSPFFPLDTTFLMFWVTLNKQKSFSENKLLVLLHISFNKQILIIKKCMLNIHINSFKKRLNLWIYFKWLKSSAKLNLCLLFNKF